jgi:hypothetical protein
VLADETASNRNSAPLELFFSTPFYFGTVLSIGGARLGKWQEWISMSTER